MFQWRSRILRSRLCRPTAPQAVPDFNGSAMLRKTVAPVLGWIRAWSCQFLLVRFPDLPS